VGQHKWWVQTWNPAGYGDLSDAILFTTDSAFPAQVDFNDADTNPEAGQNLETDYRPTFAWNKADRATYYLVRVNGPTGKILDKWFPSTYCVGDVCRVPYSAHQVTLTGGSYTWFVRTWNPVVGYGNWSAGNNFTVPDQTIPPASTLFINGLPNASAKKQPRYVWSTVPMAVSYRLYVKGPSGVVLDKWYNSVDVCASDYCSIENPATLLNGDYTWWVQTWNPAGYGPWRSQHFSVKSALDAPENLSISGGTATLPVYQWSKVTGATQYHLYVTGPGYVLDKWVNCNTDICSHTTLTALSEGGDYSWAVMPYNSLAGYGLWSASQTFSYTP